MPESEQRLAGFLCLISIGERRGNPPSRTKQGWPKTKKQSFDEATLVLSKLILAKKDCSEPLSPGFCSGYCVPIENYRSKCKACSYSNDEKKKLQDPEQRHYLWKCFKCHFVRKGSFAYHKKQCEATSAPVKHHCGIEDLKFATYHESSIHRHRRSHQEAFK